MRKRQPQRAGRGIRWKYRRQCLKRQREHSKIGAYFPSRYAQRNTGRGLETVQAATQVNLAAAVLNVVARRTTEFRERNGGHAHPPGFWRVQKRFPENLRSVADRDAIEFFIQGAYQHRFPEPFDGCVALPMSTQPLKKISAIL